MNDPPLTAPQLLWHAGGRPPTALTTEAAPGPCATCGAALTVGAPVAQISGRSTFSQQSDFVQGDHFCPACAWLMDIGKGKPGNVLALGAELHFPMISAESAAKEGRPSWLELLGRLAAADPATPVAGVLTTDFKPRLWPRMVAGTAGRPTLYVHSPDHDQSGNLTFSARQALDLTGPLQEALALGFSKARCHHGLLADFDRARKVGLPRTSALDARLRDHRAAPHWLPALLAAHKPLKEAAAHDRDPAAPAPRGADPRPAPGRAADDGPARLL